MNIKTKINISKKAKVICIIFFAFIVFFCAYIFYEQNHLIVTNYNLDTNKFNGKIQITVLSDLHNKEFGKNNINLIDTVKKQNSDIIVCLGDFVTKYDTNTEIATSLYNQLKEIAPVYACLGNHELDEIHKDIYIDAIKSTGINLLDNSMVQLPVGQDTITLGGLSDYPYYELDAPDHNNENRYFFDDFSAQTNYKLLLCHKPEVLMWGLKGHNMDLMLSGHTHGGVVRLPFLGPVYAPNQGFFPKYSEGMYKSDNTTLIISRGLGGTYFIPRINNPPEILVINISGTK